MQNEFHGDLGQLLKDIPAFNAKYGNASLYMRNQSWPAFAVAGLDLQGATFSSMAFHFQSISGSRFRNCRFEGVEFEGAVFKKCEFTQCQFIRCVWEKARFEDCMFHGGEISHGKIRFKEEDPGWTEFAHSGFEGTLFAHMRLDKAGFDSSEFKQARFEDNEYAEASFTDCKLTQPSFKGGSLKGVSMGSCLLVKPVFQDAELKDIDFSTSLIDGVNIAPPANMKGYEPRGVAFRNSTFDLSHFRGSFGLWGAEDCLIHDLDTKGNFGLGGTYVNVTLKNIHADAIELNNGGKYSKCRFEGLQAGDAYMDKSSFKDCLFTGFTVRDFMRMDSSEFENVTWENARLGAKIEFHAAGTIYEAKRPF